MASANPGWCYVTSPTAGPCPQAIVFATGSAVLANAVTRVSCTNARAVL